jgi:hypothetical protein
MIVRIFILTIIPLIIFLPQVIHSQTIEPDTTESPFAKRDTLKTLPVRSKLYWYNLDQVLKQRDEENNFDLYNLKSEIGLIYTDLTDVFRIQPLWMDYDLFESNRPSFLGSVNKFPHQTTFFHDGVVVNDLIHGMYNLQFIPVMFTQRVEGAHTQGSLRNFGMAGAAGINMVSNSLHTIAPWTRILYKQGTFGFSDIDISFVKPVTEYLSVQLGGFNKVYDGTFSNSDHHGTNYRGEITWQYNPNLFIRGQFFISRQRTGMTAFSLEQSILFPRYIEWRDDYFVDVTWQPDDSTKNRLHVMLWNTYTFRRLKDRLNPAYVIKNHAKQYGIDANYLFDISNLGILSGVGVQYPEIHGTAFQQNYSPFRAQLYAELDYPVLSDLFWRSGIQATLHKEFDPQITLNSQFNLSLSERQTLELTATRSVRFPTASELYFSFDTLYGNQSLSPEEHLTIHSEYNYRDSTLWNFQIAAGYCQVKKEIQWIEPNFLNNNKLRSFYYTDVSLSIAFWKLTVGSGGHYNFADIYLSPRASLWGKIHFHDVWLKGAVIIDAYGEAYLFDTHRNIKYEPRLDRFYIESGNTGAFYTLSWKVVATVKAARIFFEMDNPLSEDYYFVEGYPEQFIRWRFGVNWILWD